MLEILLLLLPIAAASGWFLAKRDTQRKSTSKDVDFSTQYFKGLNYLLNEQPDKAIEVFIEMLEVDSETVETHLALGNLFRRRGEVDRAIRIHQNIIARPTLQRAQRAQALFELGQDYMRAGLLDRAENLFLELIDMGDYAQQALRLLVEIYEQEKEWEKAIEITRKLAAVTAAPRNDVISHYYCELAEEARHKGNNTRAQEMLKRALSADQNNVRASILQGDMQAAANNCKGAVRAYKRVEQQDPDYLGEVVAPLRECYRARGAVADLINYLRQVVDKYEGITPTLTLADLIREQQGERAATDFIIEQLRKRASVRGLDRLIEYNLAHTEGAARENLLILKDLMNKLLENRTIYQCNVCGFEGKSMHWHCPSCKRWNTVKPVHGVVGE